MKVPVSKPLTVEEYMIMNSANTGQPNSMSEKGIWRDDRFAYDTDDTGDIEVHDLIIDEDYESDLQRTRSPEEMQRNRSLSDCRQYLSNIDVCHQPLFRENCNLQTESETTKSNDTLTRINGASGNDCTNTEDKQRGCVTHSSEGLIPIIPLPVLNRLPVFNYTPFVFNGLSSNCPLNTSNVSVPDNLVNGLPNDTSRPMSHTSKTNSIDTKSQINEHNNREVITSCSTGIRSLIKPPVTRNTSTGESAPCQENGKRTSVEIPTVVSFPTNKNVSSFKNSTGQRSGVVELLHATNPVNQYISASQRNQDRTSPTQESSTEVDNLTDTINRVAAGEGFIRQRFTPKAKRRKISDLQKQSKQISSNPVRCKEKTPIKCMEITQGNLPESVCNNGISEVRKTFPSGTHKYCKRIQSGESNVEDHYLLFRPNESEMPKMNFDASTSANMNIHHYLLQTTSTTDKTHAPTPASKEKTITGRQPIHSENTHPDSNKNSDPYIQRQIPKSQSPAAKESHTPAQSLALPISGDSNGCFNSLSMDPTVKLDRLDGVLPSTTVVLGKSFPYALQFSNINKNDTTLNDTSKRKEKSLYEQVNQAQISTETSSSATNIPNIVPQSTKIGLALKVREQPMLRTTISDKTSNVYVIPKPNKHGYEQIPKANNKIAEKDTRILIKQHCDKTRLPVKQDITTKSVPISPKAITQDVYQYLVSNTNIGTSLKASKTMVCDRPLPQAQTSMGNLYPELRPKTNTDSNKLSGTCNKQQTCVGEYSSKSTVAELLKTKRLGANCASESHVDSPLKVYGKIVNGEEKGNVHPKDNYPERYASKYIGPKINTESPTKSSQLSKPFKLTKTTCPPKTTKSNLAACTSVSTEAARCSVAITSESSNSSLLQIGIGQNTANYSTAPNSSVVAASSQGCSTAAGFSKSTDAPIELVNPFSVRIGSKMYVVKPKLVLQTAEKNDHKSQRTTLPAPKPKSVVGGKRPLDFPPGVENSNETIKKKIKRIVNRKKGPFDKLTKSLELMPMHKKEKRIKQMLKKRSRLSFSPNRFEPQANLTTNDFYGDKKELKDKYELENESGMHQNKYTTTETVKTALTMIISKASAGNLTYSVHRTKINYMPRQQKVFRRWFKHSNYPCTLHFKEGKCLDQIDVATIKQGLYLVIGAEKPFNEVDRYGPSSFSTVLALYPPHVAAIPNNSDAIVIGHIDNANDTQENIATNTIEGIEHMLRDVLGPKALKNCDSLSDERYKSIVDTNMSLRNHSPLFYSKDMHEYFTDGGTARDLDYFTDTGLDKKHSLHSRPSNVYCKEQDRGKTFVKISERAMALKIKQTKLMESCQKLQHERIQTE